MNQTTMMMKIAAHLHGHECWFSPHYTDGLIGLLARKGMLEWTIAGKRHQQRAISVLQSNRLRIDVGARHNHYDLVVTCSDLVVPRNVRTTPIVLVQEGMTDPESLMFHLVKLLRLPRYLASTSTFGLSDAYDRFCVASEGYRELFIRKGVNPQKIVVTGIPNFDDCSSLLSTQATSRGYVLVATSDARETFRRENRRSTIEQALAIAAGRDLVFKLHPNEHVSRATREIEHYAPGSRIIVEGDADALIAHCDVLITTFSSCAFVGIALGKQVYSDFPLAELRRLCPIQNGGASAMSIATVCEDVLSRSVCRVFTIGGEPMQRKAS